MDAVNIATIIVALIAAVTAELTRRSSAKAAREQTIVGGRVDMEKEAFERARKFDVDTIERQDAEIAELREKHEKCDTDIQEMKSKHEKDIRELREKYEAEVRMLRARIARLERDTVQNIEEILRERLTERPHNERESDSDI